MAKNSPAKAPEAAPAKPKEAVYTLEQHVRRHKVNPGVVASFTVEAEQSGDGLAPRSEKAWESAIRAQSRKNY